MTKMEKNNVNSSYANIKILSNNIELCNNIKNEIKEYEKIKSYYNELKNYYKNYSTLLPNESKNK